MRHVSISSELFQGCVSLEHDTDWIAPWRLPEGERGLFPSADDRLVTFAQATSGVRLRFSTDSRRIVLEVEPQENYRELDVCHEGVLLNTVEIPPGDATAEIRLAESSDPESSRVYEIWLDQREPFRLRGLLAEEGSSFSAPSDHRRRWVTYGSSITMGRAAGSPSRTWPGVAAQKRQLNVSSLGFGGECHLDPMVARVIRDLPADLITLELGINVYGGSSFTARTYPSAVIGLIRIIREKHPSIPIGVITAIHYPAGEKSPNSVGLTLEDYRQMTRDALARLVGAGDQNVHLFEGEGLLGNADAHLLHDGLHPDARGYELMGSRAAEKVLSPLLEA